MRRAIASAAVIALVLSACAREAPAAPATATAARAASASPSATASSGPVGTVLTEIVIDATAGFGIVDVQSTQFTPATLGIPVGSVLVWRNKDPIDHTVTSGSSGQKDGRFDIPLAANNRVGFRFTRAGSYPYFCSIHGPSMSGTINVF